MSYTQEEISRFVEENDVQMIHLVFCDLFGSPKQLSFLPQELARVLRDAIPFDGSAILGFSPVNRSDLFLKVDTGTMALLPAGAAPAPELRFYCYIEQPNEAPFARDGRHILSQAVKDAAAAGYSCRIGMQCEFYLFKNDENGNPTRTPLDQASYMDVAPRDRSQQVRREICLALREMGVAVERSHHEEGPGQQEIDLRHSDPLAAADNFITFKSVVQAIAGRHDLYATFMPKPLPNHSGNGCHLTIACCQREQGDDKEDAAVRRHFLAGILDHINEMTLFLNPFANSYERLGVHKAPKYIGWAPENRSQLVRIPAGQGLQNVIELRSPDPMLNPYLAFALIIYAGLAGIEGQLEPPNPLEIDLYQAPVGLLQQLKTLPNNRQQALLLAKASEFVYSHLPGSILDIYEKVKG